MLTDWQNILICPPENIYSEQSAPTVMEFGIEKGHH